MIRQQFTLPPKVKSGKKDDRNHVWEVRHAGLLGIRYEVAVRSDLFDAPKDEEADDGGRDILTGIVDAAVLGYTDFLPTRCSRSLNVPPRLNDRDDDVRAVAATCLLPVTTHLVERLPDSLNRVLAVLWTCLQDMKDDLSSSVGAVMDLLGACRLSHDLLGLIKSLAGKLVTYSKVIDILGDSNLS